MSLSDRQFTNRRYLDAIADHVLIYDGAMGTSIQGYNLTAEDFGGEQYNGCYDYLAVTKPEAIEAVHRAYFEVGVDVVETNTFRSNPLTLSEYGLGERAFEINQAALDLASKALDREDAEEEYVMAGESRLLDNATAEEMLKLRELYRRGVYSSGVHGGLEAAERELIVENLCARVDLPMNRVEVRTDEGGDGLDLAVAKVLFKELLMLRIYADPGFGVGYRYTSDDIRRARRAEDLAAHRGLKALQDAFADTVR